MLALRFLLIAAVTAASVPASASPISLVGSLGAGGSWLAAPAAAEDNSSPNTPYWDSNSWDSLSVADAPRLGYVPAYNPANLGALLEGVLPVLQAGMAARTGQAVYHIAEPAPGTVDYWADTTTKAADPDYYYALGGVPWVFSITMIGELAKRSDVNEFGWYRQGDPSARTVIFSAADSFGAHWTGTIDSDFGFYYRDATRGLLYFTETGLPGQTPGSSQQFAAFQTANRSFIGLEDRFGPIDPLACGLAVCSDYDYNDLIMAINAEPVPEPTTLLLFGGGLIGLAGMARWRHLRRQR